MLNYKINKDFLIKTLQDLVRTSSENIFVEDPSKDNSDYPIELEVANFIYDLLKDLGFSPKKVGSKYRPNIVVELGNGNKTLIFNGHMDTVPIGDIKKWKVNPFEGKIIENKLYGRGSADMKAALASYIEVLRVLSKYESKMNGKLMVHFVVDEETGATSPFGTKLLLEKGYVGDFVIIGEPGSKKICIGHKGGYRFKIITYGEPIHTGSKEWELKKKGKNAILEMVKVIEALKEIEEELPIKENKYFPGRKNVFTFPTVIRGGVGINIVPDKCEALGEFRLLPGIRLEDVKRIIRRRLEKIDVKYSLEDILFVPGVISKGHEVINLLVKHSLKVLGYKPKIEGSGPWSDLWHFVTRGIPGITFGPDGGNIHSYNEYVDLISLQKVADIYLNVAYEYLL